ncbi:hypothetical protein AMS68_007968 [Peltaster fructicola]|uniref:BHLH domain-containing protein n=1 Tax=Peltaster fructicola TaxID=286661 RepID=A0A6H0Y6I0_9PEZI|nr:hypothetical protein AMS68_007968 [Peltaster fructicola]
MTVLSPKERFTSFPPLDTTIDTDFVIDLDKHDSPIDFGFDDRLEDNPCAMEGARSPFIKTEPSEYFDLQQAMQFNQNQNIGNMNINPASLSNGGFNQNMSSSFNMGNSGIADDELLDLQINDNQGGNFDFNGGMQNFLNNPQINSAQHFSHTPEGAPIQSPFTHGFDYSSFRAMPQQQQQQFANARSLPQQTGFHPQLQDQRGTATPKTPGLNLQTPDFHPGMQRIVHRQRPSMGGSDWEGTPSGHSWNESSPFPSPANGHAMQRQISEVLNQNAHHKVASSLPTKMEPGIAPPAMQSQEAKRRRRRESHNMVERRRRDNINERIHDLGTLVPQHRLEDEKVRKHLTTNAPLSPSIANASGISPPNASLLSAAGRRATAGNITQGLPMEDKDKGPNKGDILNSSVAWTRDLMWYLQLKLRQEEQLKERMRQLGGQWPFEQTEDEKRMSSEIAEVLGKHTNTGMVNGYTRAPGTGLRVPGFTNVAGDAIHGEGVGFDSVSPGYGNTAAQNNFQWNDTFTPELKEEDEYDMEV